MDAEWLPPDLLVLLDDDDVVVGFAATSASRDNDAAVTTGEVPAFPHFERQPTLMRHHGVVTADEILAAWESRWGTLPSRMRQSFLGRAELQELTQLSSSDVTRAIRTRGPKLTAILLGATYEVRRREQLRQAAQRDSQEREERRRAAQERTPPRGSDRWSPPVPPGTIARSGY